MERILSVFVILFSVFSLILSKSNQNFEDHDHVQKNYPEVSAYEQPSFLYPVYVKVIKDLNDMERLRDNLRITLGTIKRKKRSRPFTRFNSTVGILAEALAISKAKPTQVVYSATTNSSIVIKPLISEPLIMIRSPTKSTVKPISKKVVSQVPKVDRAKSSLTNTTTTLKPNSTSTIKTVVTSKPAKPAKKPHPDPPPPPPIGDVTEEEDDEEEEEEDDFPNSESSENSSEEEEDDEEERKPQKSEAQLKQSSKNKSSLTTTSKVPTKGDTGSIESQSDKSESKKKKKSHKKKKGHKKVKLHFIPAPLGPKADLMVRLDKVHHNVREIFSVVKGVFSDYVVSRPHVNIEVALKGEKHPHEKVYQDRSDWFDAYEPDAPKKRKRKNPNKSTSISKRIGEFECLDDEECESRPLPQPPKKNKKRPYSIQRVPMPYPIYMESSDDYSPFDGLPPLTPNYYTSREKAWVRTWDKKKNGLPTIADPSEASKRVKHRPIEQESEELYY